MKFKLHEDLESIIEREYPDNPYGYDDLNEIKEMTYNSYSDEELWEAFKDIAWPEFSEYDKKKFLDDFEDGYQSILEVPTEEGMADRGWIIDALEDLDFFDEDYFNYAYEYFSTDHYLDNLEDYKIFDDARKGIGVNAPL